MTSPADVGAVDAVDVAGQDVGEQVREGGPADYVFWPPESWQDR